MSHEGPRETEHAEAWDLAHHRRENSNLAMCYIELRKTVKIAIDGDQDAMEKLRAIDATSEDSVVSDR